MRITVGSRFTAKLAGPAALAMLLSLGTAGWAQEASSESVSDLRSEVRELQKEIHELKGQVETVKSQQALVPPPPADQKPQTIGETVGSLGKNVEDIRTNLATNLGIQVHGLVDVGAVLRNVGELHLWRKGRRNDQHVALFDHRHLRSGTDGRSDARVLGEKDWCA